MRLTAGGLEDKLQEAADSIEPTQNMTSRVSPFVSFPSLNCFLSSSATWCLIVLKSHLFVDFFHKYHPTWTTWLSHALAATLWQGGCVLCCSHAKTFHHCGHWGWIQMSTLHCACRLCGDIRGESASAGGCHQRNLKLTYCRLPERLHQIHRCYTVDCWQNN